MSKILVTGGAGFIGSHLVTRLVKEGHSVRVLDDLSSGHMKNLEGVLPSIEFVRGDIRDPVVVSRATGGIEALFHEAALSSVPRSIDNPVLVNEVNVTGTLNVLEACRKNGVRRVVFASSSSFYGDTEVLPKVESMPEHVKSPYAATKLTGELYLRLYHQVYGLETLSLRYFNVFGPRQDPKSEYAAVIPLFVTRLLANQAPTIYGNGRQTRDFTYIDNVVEANLLALKAPRLAGEAINIGSGKRTSLLQLLEAIKKRTGGEIEPLFEAARVGDVRHSLAGIELAKELIGYSPLVDFNEGVSRTVTWFQQNPASE